MQFAFATAGRIIFGPGTVAQAGKLAAGLGRRAFVVTGSSGERASRVMQALGEAQVAVTDFRVAHEPTTELVREGVVRAREAGCDLVVGIGGGSVIDCGKAIAALLTNGGVPLDYLEVIGGGQPITERSAPYIAIPTTAGTGTEVTANAVLASPEHRVKVSLRGSLILPHIAIVDPALTYSMSPDVTASTGLDAFTQLLEPYVSRLANPLTDALCREGLWRASWALPQAFAQGDNADARENMALASLLGGLALANAKLGAVHGFAGVIGGMFDAPHGAVCGRLLPFVMATNVGALSERDADNPALARYGEVAAILTGEVEATPKMAVAWVEALCETLGVPGLATYDITPKAFPDIVAKAQVSSSMKGNPIALTDDELTAILRKAL